MEPYGLAADAGGSPGLLPGTTAEPEDGHVAQTDDTVVAGAAAQARASLTPWRHTAAFARKRATHPGLERMPPRACMPHCELM